MRKVKPVKKMQMYNVKVDDILKVISEECKVRHEVKENYYEDMVKWVEDVNDNFMKHIFFIDSEQLKSVEQEGNVGRYIIGVYKEEFRGLIITYHVESVEGISFFYNVFLKKYKLQDIYVVDVLKLKVVDIEVKLNPAYNDYDIKEIKKKK